VPHAGFVGSGAAWAGEVVPGEPQHRRQHEHEQEHTRERTTRNHRLQCNAANTRGARRTAQEGTARETAALGSDVFSVLITSTGMAESARE
jgi:hypothetical protein